ncbi:MAG TPA: DUF1232 domain-containing protein [Spirochaetota bacterium]|nr:DUF1232 domain-containing protein [Spirochaetota bacterium]HPI90486.1 DUF1232 domain-containing protein [Spirochaetota bacterium]HPR46930.1 DUF1232 domain-containing protein [Spirochaetota bacterium]
MIKNLKGTKNRFILSVFFFSIAIVYLISPIDFIPDILIPAGYLDDIPFLLLTAINAGHSYKKLKNEQKK